MGVKALLVLVAAVAAGALAIVPSLDPPKPPAPATQPPRAASGLPLTKVTLAGKEHEVEVAGDSRAIQRGLAGRSDIPEGKGMVFVYPIPETLNFWMKDCLVDIDIVFIDGKGTVTAAYTMPREPPRAKGETLTAYEARLPRYTSKVPVRFAIETRAGTNERLGLKVGSTVTLDAKALDALTNWR